MSSTEKQLLGFMDEALGLARAGIGTTGTNPSVGCIIVQNGIVVGAGYTQPGGRPHGEAMALLMAQEKARGATAFVTLEPCAHKSTRGPSCCNSLIEAGLTEVYVAMLDPDPRTCGKGVERMRASGIHVEVGLMADEAKAVIADFAARFSQNSCQ